MNCWWSYAKAVLFSILASWFYVHVDQNIMIFFPWLWLLIKAPGSINNQTINHLCQCSEEVLYFCRISMKNTAVAVRLEISMAVTHSPHPYIWEVFPVSPPDHPLCFRGQPLHQMEKSWDAPSGKYMKDKRAKMLELQRKKVFVLGRCCKRLETLWLGKPAHQHFTCVHTQVIWKWRGKVFLQLQDFKEGTQSPVTPFVEFYLWKLNPVSSSPNGTPCPLLILLLQA